MPIALSCYLPVTLLPLALQSSLEYALSRGT